MRKEELHNLLMHPEDLSDEQLHELRETVARFPFFGAAQIALTQAFKARGDVEFIDQLSQAAIYTGHRASLYRRLKGVHKPTPKTQFVSEKVTSTLADRILDEEISVEFIPAIEEKPEAEFTLLPTPVAAPVIEIPPTIEEVQLLRLTDLDPLEAQILVSAVNTTIELEVQPEASEFIESNESAKPEETIDEDSYAALIYRRAQRKNLLPATDQTPREPDVSDEGLPAFRSTPLSHGVQRIRSTDTKQHQRDIVDRFIQFEPQIARGKAGDYPSGNMAKDSLEEDFSLVTETMALLFAKQGKLDKARKAFRKLMEQHPEKSIYFAAQLKNLEHFKK